MSEDHYKNYTTTSVLSGVDVNKFTRWSHAYFKKYLLPHIPKEKDTSILEIGCGYGRYTSLLTVDLSYTNVVGIDISEEQIVYAQSNYKLKNVYRADALSYLEEKQIKYDVVILMDVLEHLDLDYAIKLLKAINSHLNTNGKLIIQVPNGLSPMKPLFYGDVTHVRPFSVNSMAQLLRMAEFTNFSSFSLPILGHSLKSYILRWTWFVLVNPLIHLFMILTNGDLAGGIYSSNLLTVAYKQQ